MKISDILQQECLRVPLQATDKIGAITELVAVLDESDQLADREQVLRAVLAREETRSTGIGHGLAVPHGKSHGCHKLAMAVGKPTAPIDFEAIDGKPCEFIVLVASPADETGPHIQALASISRLWLNEKFRGAIAQVSTADELYSAIEQYQG